MTIRRRKVEERIQKNSRYVLSCVFEIISNVPRPKKRKRSSKLPNEQNKKLKESLQRLPQRPKRRLLKLLRQRRLRRTVIWTIGRSQLQRMMMT